MKKQLLLVALVASLAALTSCEKNEIPTVTDSPWRAVRVDTALNYIHVLDLRTGIESPTRLEANIESELFMLDYNISGDYLEVWIEDLKITGWDDLNLDENVYLLPE